MCHASRDGRVGIDRDQRVIEVRICASDTRTDHSEECAVAKRERIKLHVVCVGSNVIAPHRDLTEIGQHVCVPIQAEQIGISRRSTSHKVQEIVDGIEGHIPFTLRTSTEEVEVEQVACVRIDADQHVAVITQNLIRSRTDNVCQKERRSDKCRGPRIWVDSIQRRVKRFCREQHVRWRVIVRDRAAGFLIEQLRSVGWIAEHQSHSLVDFIRRVRRHCH